MNQKNKSMLQSSDKGSYLFTLGNFRHFFCSFFKLDFMHKGHIDIYKTNESKLMIHYLYMHTLIPIELLPYLQCVAITETKGSLDELIENFKKKRRNEPKN
jgi:hypothetical protein